MVSDWSSDVCSSDLDWAAHAQRSLASVGKDALQDRCGLEVPPDHRIDMGEARQQRSIGMEHRDGRAFAENDGSEEFLITRRVDAPRHHAKEDSVRSTE